VEILLEEMSEMKIQNINQGKIQGATTDKEVSAEEKTSSTSNKPIKKKDEKSLSRMAELVSRAKARAESVPEVRENRIKEVEQKLNSGAYDDIKVKEELSLRLARRIKNILSK